MACYHFDGLDVDVAVDLLSKSLVADVAGEGPLLEVLQLDVLLQDGLGGTLVVAVVALERLVPGVDSLLVVLEVAFLAKGGRALVAGELLLGALLRRLLLLLLGLVWSSHAGNLKLLEMS